MLRWHYPKIAQNDDPIQVTDKVKAHILHLCTEKDVVFLRLLNLTVEQQRDDFAVGLKYMATFINTFDDFLDIFLCIWTFRHTKPFYRQNMIFHIMQYLSGFFILLLKLLEVLIFQRVLLLGQHQFLVQLFLELKKMIQIDSKKVEHQKKEQRQRQNFQICRSLLRQKDSIEQDDQLHQKGKKKDGVDIPSAFLKLIAIDISNDESDRHDDENAADRRHAKPKEPCLERLLRSELREQRYNRYRADIHDDQIQIKKGSINELILILLVKAGDQQHCTKPESGHPDRILM